MIKYLRKIFIFTFLAFGLFISPNAFAAEKINSFDAEIKINADASINVSERIEYDFGSAQKHGIFRDIPIKYQARGGNFALRISDISVNDEKGTPNKFTTSYPGDNIQIKIGDPNIEITGRHIYIINYTIKRAINYFDNHDELYWNITGNDWPVAIGSASAKIIFPQKIASADIQSDCFAGPFGSTIRCNSDFMQSGMTNYVGFDNNQLSAYNGLTIVVGFPKGIVIKPSNFEVALETAKDNWIIGLPIIVLIVCFYLWYTRGRDPAGRGIIIAQYDSPDNLTPAEVGTIADEHAQNKDITAEIIFLATLGYLKIRQTENKILIFKSKDYELEIIKNDFSQLNDFQKTIMNGLSKEAAAQIVKLSDLKNKFYKDLKEAKDKVYQSVAEKGYFKTNPNKIRGIFALIGVPMIMLGFFLGGFFGAIGTISLAVSGAVLVIFGYIIPARTKKGVETKEHILGLKLYMSVAEARRLEFHNAPEKKPEVFEKLLPYAMALGVEKQWAKQFEGIYDQQPSWYQGSAGAFNAVMFTSIMSDFSHSANSTMASSPGGGSGFSGGGSGGGGGGGGGGSW
ncbi:DUF2207 domain-containing protein [Patescibacteria group bacterium]|nr:MAG: DUF2207 domain-containing protein [Patescibacteria group bacterium]